MTLTSVWILDYSDVEDLLLDSVHSRDVYQVAHCT